jgi:hypothetical protein
MMGKFFKENETHRSCWLGKVFLVVWLFGVIGEDVYGFKDTRRVLGWGHTIFSCRTMLHGD